ncbi:MAG TPA: rod-binding protein [Holophaga sp.]|nr:rod-binding protein [Holophaga sp.]
MDASLLLQSAVQAPQDLAAPRVGLDKLTDLEAARMFEGLVMTQMFQGMRKTIPHSGLFGDASKNQSTYEYLLDQAVVEHAMASGKGLGLASQLENSITRATKEPSTSSGN